MMHTRTHERTQSLTTRTRTSFGNVHRTDRSTYPNRILVWIFFSCDYRSRRRSVPSVVFLRNRWGAFFSPNFQFYFVPGWPNCFPHHKQFKNSSTTTIGGEAMKHMFNIEFTFGMWSNGGNFIDWGLLTLCTRPHTIWCLRSLILRLSTAQSLQAFHLIIT